jgi:hypothetical protein
MKRIYTTFFIVITILQAFAKAAKLAMVSISGAGQMQLARGVRHEKATKKYAVK